jgi:hypothetical protein
MYTSMYIKPEFFFCAYNCGVLVYVCRVDCRTTYGESLFKIWMFSTALVPMFLPYVATLFSYPMFLPYVPTVCSYPMFLPYVPALCSCPMFLPYVPALCSCPMCLTCVLTGFDPSKFKAHPLQPEGFELLLFLEDESREEGESCSKYCCRLAKKVLEAGKEG